MDLEPPPTITFLLLAVYSRPPKGSKQDPNWLSTVAVWPGEASGAQLDSAISHGVREGLLEGRPDIKLRMHFGLSSDLPQGKTWDRPDWTDGDVRLWDCRRLEQWAP